MLEHEPKFGEEVAGRAADAQQMRHLANDGNAYEAFDEPPHHRRGDECGDPPHAERAEEQEENPDQDARVEVSELKSAVPGTAMEPTVSAEIRPVAVSGPTTSRR